MRLFALQKQLLSTLFNSYSIRSLNQSISSVSQRTMQIRWYRYFVKNLGLQAAIPCLPMKGEHFHRLARRGYLGAQIRGSLSLATRFRVFDIETHAVARNTSGVITHVRNTWPVVFRPLHHLQRAASRSQFFPTTKTSRHWSFCFL